MNIYLKWKQKSGFVQSHIPIFRLEIAQKEGHFARAKLTIDASTKLPPSGTLGLLDKEDGTRLLRGQLMGIPVKIDTYFAEIELVAYPDNFQEQNEELQKKSRNAPFWNALWVKPEKHDDYQEIQVIKTASLYCDRVTGKLSWSDWFNEGKTVDIGSNFFLDSLKVRLIRTPLKSCSVNVKAHWIQSDWGVENVSSAIRRAFPHHLVSTFTPQSLSKKWPETGKRVGRSGIWILKSKLRPMNPLGKTFKRSSPPIKVEAKGKSEQTCHALRAWYKPNLWVGWKYKQKRSETLSVTLEHDIEPAFPVPYETKTLEYTLQDINPNPNVYPWQPRTYYPRGSKVIYDNGIYACLANHTSALSFQDLDVWKLKRTFCTPLGNPARESFFLTDEGYKAAEHAMERAKYELAKSARYLEVSFQSTWDLLENLTTDISAELLDPSLPQGEVKGKVVRCALIADGESGKRWGQATIVVTPSSKRFNQQTLMPAPGYVEENYCEESCQAFENQLCQTASGLRYYRYDDQTPPKLFMHHRILRGIELTNGPQDQEDHLVNQTFKSRRDIETELSKNATRLRFYFNDIRTKERLEHSIMVRMAEPWASQVT